MQAVIATPDNASPSTHAVVASPTCRADCDVGTRLQSLKLQCADIVADDGVSKPDALAFVSIVNQMENLIMESEFHRARIVDQLTLTHKRHVDNLVAKHRDEIEGMRQIITQLRNQDNHFKTTQKRR